MHWIDDKLVSDDLLDEFFSCALGACKGACCWEGDFGAPLDEEELRELDEITTYLMDDLPEESRRVIREQGPYTYYEPLGKFGTSLRSDGACVFLRFDEGGVGFCSIERAWQEGRVSFQKPISCHLYPIRAERHEATGMTALNYDRWSICAAACHKGKGEKVRLYEFAEAALSRAYGRDFFEALADAAAHREATK